MDKKEIAKKLKLASVVAQATKAARPAELVYEIVGKEILDEGTRTALREGLEQNLAKLLPDTLSGAKRLAINGATGGTRVVAKASKTTMQQVAPNMTKVALREITRCAGRASVVGGAIDGAFGAWEAGTKYRSGEMDARDAVLHVAKETSTGMISSAAGVLTVAGLIAVTGPVSVPMIIGVGTIASVTTKLGLTSFFG